MTARPAAPTSFAARDLGLLLYLGAVWGGAFLFLRIAAPEVGPLWAAEARVALAAVVLVAFAGRRTWAAARGRLLRLVVVGAAFSAIPFSLIAFAALTLPAGLGALLNAATPLFTAVLGVVMLGQALSRRVVAGLAVGVLAVLVLVGWSPLPAEPGTLIAVIAALGASLSYAFGGSFVGRYLRGVGGLELATGQVVAGALLLLVPAILSGPPGTPSAAGAASLLAIGTISTAFAWPVFYRVLRHTTPTAASTVTFIVPAFGMTWGALVLAEPIGPGLVAGFALILVSLSLVLGLVPDLPAVVRRTGRSLRALAPA